MTPLYFVDQRSKRVQGGAGAPSGSVMTMPVTSFPAVAPIITSMLL